MELGGEEALVAEEVEVDAGGESGAKQTRQRKPKAWYTAMKALMETHNNERPSDAELVAVNEAHGGEQCVTLKAAKEYVAERRKTLRKSAADRMAKTGSPYPQLPGGEEAEALLSGLTKKKPGPKPKTLLDTVGAQVQVEVTAAGVGGAAGAPAVLQGALPSCAHPDGGLFRGVYRHGGKYHSQVFKDTAFFYVGAYGSPEEAARAHDDSARKLGVDEKQMNYPTAGTDREPPAAAPAARAKQAREAPAPAPAPPAKKPALQKAAPLAPVAPVAPTAPTAPLLVAKSAEEFLANIRPKLSDVAATVSAMQRGGLTLAHLFVLRETLNDETVSTYARADVMNRLFLSLDISKASDQLSLEMALAKGGVAHS